jgi:hypothetical protein
MGLASQLTIFQEESVWPGSGIPRRNSRYAIEYFDIHVLAEEHSGGGLVFTVSNARLGIVSSVTVGTF